jgi:hypothetical protein
VNIRLPDGSILRGVPDGTSKKDLQDRLIRNGQGHRLVATGVDLAKPETEVRPDTPQYQVGAAGLPQAAKEVAQEGGAVSNFAAGAGSKLNDWAMGLKQMAGQELTPEEQSGIQAGRSFREGSLAAKVGAGALPVALGAIAAPSMGIASMAAEGGLLGAVEPTLGQESRTMNTGLGAGLGAITGGIARGITGKAGSDIIAAHPELVAGGKIPTYGEVGVAGGKVGGAALKRAEDFVSSYMAKIPNASPTDMLAAAVSTFGAGSGTVFAIANLLGIGLPGAGGVAAGLLATYTPAVRNILTGASGSAGAKALRAGAGTIGRTARETIKGILTRNEE